MVRVNYPVDVVPPAASLTQIISKSKRAPAQGVGPNFSSWRSQPPHPCLLPPFQ